MCGIAGVLRRDNLPIAPRSLRGACVALEHRGPDDSGWWIDEDGRGCVGLAAVRLAVLDTTSAGHQPMHRCDGRYHLIYNGEVYNFRALRQELIAFGESFASDSDSEVVLACCARWGTDALDKFNGMWALAFYDSQERTGFIARDRFGIKPLLYADCSAALVFASEFGALGPLQAFDDGIDRDALIEHLQFGYISGSATIYQGVRRVPPGHFLTLDGPGSSSPTSFASFNPEQHRAEEPDYGESCVRVRRILAEAVTCRRVSDVPIGAFLSGGLDSSIMVAHLSEALGKPIKTFSVGYAGHGRYDETRFARLVSNTVGTEHHELVLSERDVIDAIPKVLDHLGEPVGDSSIIPTSLLSAFARQHVTVALSGDGGDELFGGYWRYLGHDALASYQRIPLIARRGLLNPLLRALAASKSSGLGNRLRQWRKLVRASGEDPLGRHIAWSRILSPEAADGLFERSLAEACESRFASTATQLTAGLHNGDALNRILMLDLRHQLPADMLQKVDLASMMYSLEVRVPFLDRRVVELALALPSSFKIDRGARKKILTDAYRGHLPDAVLDRSKQGFEVPVGEYLRGSLLPMFRDTVTRGCVESMEVLQYAGVERLLADHCTRRSDNTDVLFALLSLCWWRQRAKSNPGTVAG
jgi:asparagine synthase (glutamine-hydrolysing)